MTIETEFPEVEFVADFDYHTSPSSFVAYKAGTKTKVPRECLRWAKEAGVIKINAPQTKPVGSNKGAKA